MYHWWVAEATPDSVVAHLHQFGLERDRFRSALAGLLNLTGTDLDALEHLERDAPLTQRELGERLLLTSGAVTMLVDRLERLDLVRRRPNPDDRRSALIELASEVSLPKVPELEDYHHLLAAAAAAIPAAHRAEVIAFLQAVSERAALATTSMRERTPPRVRATRHPRT